MRRLSIFRISVLGIILIALWIFIAPLDHPPIERVDVAVKHISPLPLQKSISLFDVEEGTQKGTFIFSSPRLPKPIVAEGTLPFPRGEKKEYDKIEGIDRGWLDALKRKMNCMKEGKVGLFLNHARKSAGTTLRGILETQSTIYKIPFFELEGLTMDTGLQQAPGLFTATSLRNPIERIISLYWYEHVAWWDLRHDMSSCKSFEQWFMNWIDMSPHKIEFMAKNPFSNYVEVENYYVKSLTGWRDTRHVLSREDLDKAKAVLGTFDLVLITEWMNNRTQLAAVTTLLPGSSPALSSHLVKLDPYLKKKYSERLMPSRAGIGSILNRISTLNALDMELWVYALELVARRQALIITEFSETRLSKGNGTDPSEVSMSMSACVPMEKSSVPRVPSIRGVKSRKSDLTAAIFAKNPSLQQKIGLFQPPGHKK